MSAWTIWWVIAGVLVAAELVVGTVYLLMVALGAAAGAVAAHLSLELTGQLVAAAIVGAGAVTAWHLRRARAPKKAPATADKSVNLDVGEQVQVAAWQSDQTTTVHFRGADWSASLKPGAPMRSGTHRIAEVLGSRLVLEPVA